MANINKEIEDLCILIFRKLDEQKELDSDEEALYLSVDDYLTNVRESRGEESEEPF